MAESKTALRTRRCIVNAMVELLREKSFDDISVTDVSERAMITRATFYKYYEDKYHLIKSIIQEHKESLIDAQLGNFDYSNIKALCLKIAEIGVDYILCNENDFYLFVEHSNNERLINILVEMTNTYIEDFLKKVKNSNFKVPVPALSRFITGGLVYAGIYFIKNRGKYKKEEILSYIEYMIENGPLGLKQN